MKIFFLFFFIITWISPCLLFSQTAPTSIPGLAVWLRSDSGVVLNGSNVSRWNDLSGNNYSFNSIGASSNPLFNISEQNINNKPTLNFDGSNDGLLSNKFVVLGNSGTTIYIVTKVNTFTPYGMLLCYGVNSSGSINLRLRPAEAKITLVDGTTNNGVGLSNSNANLLTSSNYEILTGSFESAPSKWKVAENNLSKDSIIQSFTQADSNLLAIGFRNDNFGYLSENIAEIILFKRVLTETENSQIIDYLEAKYAPPINLGKDTLVCMLPYTLKAKKDYFTSYQWQDASTNDSLVINSAGTYYLTTTDIFGRVSSDTIKITQDTVTYNVNLGTDTAICNGSQIVLNAGPSLYSYSWLNAAGTNTYTVSSAGLYFVSVTDCKSHVSKDSITITINPVPVFSLGNDIVGCYNAQPQLKPDLTPLTNYSFLWSDSSTDTVLTVTSSGKYWLQAKNGAGCTFTDSIIVAIDSILFPVSLGADVSLCSGNSISLISGIGIGSGYTWSDGSHNDSLQVINPVGNYSYWLTVNDVNGCSKTDTINVTVAGTAPVANFTSNSTCLGGAIQFNDLSVPPGGNTITNWLWDFGDGNSSISQNPLYVYAAAGSYLVKLTVTTNIGCTHQLIKTVNVYPVPQANFNYSSSANSLTYSFYENTVTNGIAINNRQWKDNGTLFSYASSFTKTFPSIGTYTITLIVTNAKGCVDSITKTINVVNTPPINNSPTTITGLKVWLRSDSNVVKNAGAVSSWADISGNGYVFNAANTSTKPVFVSNNSHIKNKASLVFDGIDDGLKSNKAVVLGTQGVSVYVVSKTPAFKAYGVAVAYGTNLLGSWNFIERGSVANITLINGANNNGAGTLNSNSSDLTTKDFTILQGSLNDAADKWKIGENSIIKDSVVTPFTQLDSNFVTIGYRDDGIGFSNEEIAEVIIFDQELNSTDNQKVIQYLRGRYTTPLNIGPSTDNVCDTSTTLTVGGHFPSILWSDGSTNDTITINHNDTVSVSVKDVFDFVSKDTVILQGFQTPFTFYSLPDTISCGSSINWSPGLNPANHNFLWSTGSTAASIMIPTSNNYSVQITDTNGCTVYSPIVKATIDNFASTVSLGNDTTFCAGNSISLASGAAQSTSYLWSDNSSASSLAINSSGTYWLTVQDSNHCSASDTINITVSGQAPIADFTYSIACLNDTVSFFDLSSASGGSSLTNWQWTFGDSSSGSADSSIAQSPMHLFSSTGNYTVNLNITNSAGCKQNKQLTVFVAPKPLVTFNTALACGADSVLFTNNSSSPGYPITSYSWNFGDPTSGIKNSSSLISPYHTFTSIQSYNITLLAINNQGCRDSVTNVITVNVPVTADFTYSQPCTNEPVRFQDISTVPAPYTTYTNTWSINGNILTGSAPSFPYNVPGTNPVTLTITVPNGCSSSITKSIVVKSPPTVNFSCTNFCMNDTVHPVNNSFDGTSTITSWNWKLDNVSISTLQNTFITSPDSGFHSVRLTAVNAFNCKDSVSTTITVYPLPHIDFTSNPATAIFPLSPVTLSPNYTSGLYSWTIPGLLTSSLVSPTVSFPDTGNYVTTVKYTDGNGCKNTKQKNIHVGPRFLDLAMLDLTPNLQSDNYCNIATTLANSGNFTITSFEIGLSVSNSSTLKETWTGTLNPGAVLNYTFNSHPLVKDPDQTVICATIQKVNTITDDVLSNNDLCASIEGLSTQVLAPYPNPASTSVLFPIVLDKEATVIFEIYDLLGKKVFSAEQLSNTLGLNLMSVSLESLDRSSYTAKITIGNKTYFKKIVKN